jgi:hypothetical protein
LRVPEEKHGKLLAALNSKVTFPIPCPLCHTADWDLNPEIFQYSPYSKGTLVAGGLLFPVILLVCKKCGNTISISAVKLGIVNPETGDLSLD